ncbi:MAG: HD domain-containing protein [Halanaerobacter sp.]
MEKVSLEEVFNQELKKTLIIVMVILLLILFSIASLVYKYLYDYQQQQAETLISYFFNDTAEFLEGVENKYNQQLKASLLNFYEGYSGQNKQEYINQEIKRIKNQVYQMNKAHEMKVKEVNYYLINPEGRVFSTDYNPDQGLDLTQLEGQWSKLQKLEPGEVLLLPFNAEVATSRMRLYAYVKLPDGNYFEIGILFENLDKLLSKRAEEINQNPDLELKLFTAGFDSLFKEDIKLSQKEKRLLKESGSENKLINQEVSFYEQNYYQAWSSEYGNLYSVLNINHTPLQIIFNLILVLLVVILIAIYLGRQKLHQRIEEILVPIQKVAYDMNQFYKKKENDPNINDTGIIEVDNIIDNYINMAHEVRASYQQLEAYSEELEEKNKELAKNKKRIRKIIDLSPNHIFIKNRAGEYILTNQTHADFFNKKVEELQGTLHQELEQFDQAKLKELEKENQEVIDNNLEKVFEDHVTDNEGQEKIFESTKIPFNEDDETYILAIARDITKEVETKNKIKEQKSELEASYQQLEAYNEEVLKLNQNLEAAYQERDGLVKKLEKLIDLTARLTRESLTDTQEFLSQLLHSAFEIIEEADYGTVFSLGEENIEFIDTIGHDLEALQSLGLENEIFEFTPTQPEIIENRTVMSVVKNKLDGRLRREFLKATEAVNETIMFALVVDGERKAGFSLDIAKKREEEFSQQSLDIMNAFNSLAISFYIMQSYSNMRSDFQSQIVSSLINLLEVHDQYTKGHSENVARLGTKVAFELGLSIEEINDVYWAGLMHDIGKTVIPEEILNKSTRLTDEEFEKIKKHPVWGYKALKDSKQLEEIAEYIHYHHERPDGEGYPEGLVAEEIPLISKILSVVDAWDAMRSTRSYRDSLPKEVALKELLDNRGGQFSPEVVDAFLKIINEENKPL